MLNRLQSTYFLAKEFVELPHHQKFTIGKDLGILQEMDALMPTEDLEDYVFTEVLKKKMQVQLLRLISRTWE